MNTRSQSLRNGAWLLMTFGLVLMIVGPTVRDVDPDPFTNVVGTALLAIGLVMLLAGMVWLGLSIMVRAETVAVPAQQPQPEPQPYYPPTA
jgi:energy-converting hydrogenase Eha subunit C